MIGGILALAFLLAVGTLGAAALQRADLGLDQLEQIAYGFPLGAVTATLAILLLAIAFGLNAAVVALVAVIWFGAAVALVLDRSLVARAFSRSSGVIQRPLKFNVHQWWGGTPTGAPGAIPLAATTRVVRLNFWPIIVLGLLSLRWAFFFRSALTSPGGALWAGHEFIWSDWSAHIGDVTSFAYGDNFPPENARVQGKPFAYHYLASLNSAALVKLGLSPTAALSLGSWFFSVFIGLAVFAFARRAIRHRGAAALATVLFLFGGRPVRGECRSRYVTSTTNPG